MWYTTEQPVATSHGLNISTLPMLMHAHLANHTFDQTLEEHCSLGILQLLCSYCTYPSSSSVLSSSTKRSWSPYFLHCFRLLLQSKHLSQLSLMLRKYWSGCR